MAQPSFHGSAESIWQAVMAMGLPSLASFSVEVLPEIDSTNTELMRRARAGRTEPTLLVAQQQTAGRGRLGRHWDSGAERGEGGSAQAGALTFSLGLLLQPASWDGLSLAVGVSVASSLHANIALKWPNDLWVNDRKLGGILIETQQPGSAGLPSYAANGALNAARYAVIGVGINVAPRPPSDFSTPPAALQELWPLMSAAQALQRVVAYLLHDVLLFEREGFAAFASRFAALDALHGRNVTLHNHAHSPNRSCTSVAASNAQDIDSTGIAQGVDTRGAFLIQTQLGVRAITSAEVSVRPAVN